MQLPTEYIIQQIMLYAGQAKLRRDGIVQAGCPACHEGKSWGRKRRLFYIPKFQNIHCKNCNQSWTPVQWIMTFGSKTFKEVTAESKDYEYIPVEMLVKDGINESNKELPNLPHNSINLFDAQQVNFFRDSDVVKEAISVIAKRRLATAINRPNTYYVSLTDPVHKNRLCIPFENDGNIIEYYQTRTLIPSDTSPKYLSKMGGQKTVFGINRINEDIDYIFKFEGPIDATFVQNGVGLCGVTESSLQTQQLRAFPFHKQIWVLDNQHIDATAKTKTWDLIKAGESVFLWPKGSPHKDFNDIAKATGVNEISIHHILENTANGLQAELKFKNLF